MDVLTEVIRSAGIRNVIYGRLELSAPWGMKIEGSRELTFYAVARGAAVLEVGGRRVALGVGDLVFVRKGLAHVMKDHPRSRAATVAEVYAQRGGRCGGLVRYGGDGPVTTILSGGFTFETTELHPMLGHLPEVFHVPAEDGELVRWLELTLGLMTCEMKVEEPGYELVASRLADVLFVHALRRHVKDNPCQAGWLRAVADPQLGQAFRAMHARPDEPWTVESLAHLAGMSRSAFAARFKEVLDVAPLAYLTRWRMHRATVLLTTTTRTVAEIALAVGYETESAFAKVFRRHLGTTPAAYRRLQKGRASTLAPDEPTPDHRLPS